MLANKTLLYAIILTEKSIEYVIFFFFTWMILPSLPPPYLSAPLSGNLSVKNNPCLLNLLLNMVKHFVV